MSLPTLKQSEALSSVLSTDGEMTELEAAEVSLVRSLNGTVNDAFIMLMNRRQSEAFQAASDAVIPRLGAKLLAEHGDDYDATSLRETIAWVVRKHRGKRFIVRAGMSLLDVTGRRKRPRAP